MAYKNTRLRLLLTDASGLTARQVATQAACAGHLVEALSPTRVCLGAFTRHVERIHVVPAFGRDPAAWPEATLAVLREGRHDVLLPTQEQAALLAREPQRVRRLGVGLAVPPFESLLRVQDKVAQNVTLGELGLPHPPTWVVRSHAELLREVAPPAYLKSPVGTASNAVRLARDRVDLDRAAELEFAEGIVAQRAVPGALVMVQAVFDRGRLVARHANLREREGCSGGASVKRGVAVAGLDEHLETLGGALSWHGALSLDAILTPAGPSYIDVNPRLVEPGNAWRSGCDLVEAMIAVSTGREMPRRVGRSGVRTHQLLIGVLGAAEAGHGRRGVIRELASGLGRRGPHRGSVEELTPPARDPLAAAPVAAAAIATIVRPKSWRSFAGGAVSGYALTPAAWELIAGPRAPATVAAPSRRPR